MALYHAHRPQRFVDVVGQEHIVTTLQNQIANNSTAHAYLFSGPRGVGKTTSARLLAKALTCQNKKKGEPCNTCESCTEIGESRSIDVIEIDAASHTGVDHVREHIIENAQFRPTSLSHKIFIIDEVHMLSTSAFNALLKTLEEPPPYVLFILATTEPHKLPETIISRCQRFHFKRVPFEIMKQHLESIAAAEKISVESSVFDRIVNKSDGCVRDAVSLLDQLMATGEKKITDEAASHLLPTTHIETTATFIRSLVYKKAEDGLDLIASLGEQGTHFPQFALDSLELLRTMLIMKTTGSISSSANLDESAITDLKSITETISHADLVLLIDLLMKRKQQIQAAPLPQLPLEMLVVEWCYSDHETRGKQTQTHQTEVKQTSPNASQATISKQEAEPVKKTLTEKVKEIISKDPICTLDEAQASWNTVIEQVEAISPSLVFILKMAEVTNVTGHVLHISVPYLFHKDKLLGTTSYKQICDVASEIYGARVDFDIAVNEEAQQSSQDSDIQELAAAFGGEVVQ